MCKSEVGAKNLKGPSFKDEMSECILDPVGYK